MLLFFASRLSFVLNFPLCFTFLEAFLICRIIEVKEESVGVLLHHF